MPFMNCVEAVKLRLGWLPYVAQIIGTAYIEHSVYSTRKVSVQVPIELSTADQGSEQAKLQRWLQSS